jgi:hypothetical protein
VFASNVSKTRLVNTFSGADQVVGLAWHAHQLTQKPAVSFLGLGSEGPDAMFWGALLNTSDAENQVWSAGTGAPIEAIRNTTRQWAELAYWFPVTTKAVGVIGGEGPSWLRHDFSSVGAGGTLPSSHSYMTQFPFSQVWSAWATVSLELK